MAIVIVIYLVRLFVLQVLDSGYRDQAESNAFYPEISYPPRGIIKDRNGKAIAFNKDAYDVMITPREAKGLDTASFCQSLGITKEFFDERMEKIRKTPGYSPFVPQTFLTQLSQEDFAAFQEKLLLYNGVELRRRTLRDYSYPCAALVLGNIGEVSKKKLEKDPYYQPGDFAGLNGLELTYEEKLRGEKGVKIWLRDAHGRKQGRLEDGARDKQAVAGKNITTSLDIDLQMYGEKLMQNKVGSIVCIEPSTGEILAMVSAPSYDPSLLVGRKRSKEYTKLYNDPYKPLFDRAAMALYPPGSTFKPANTLALMEEGFVYPEKVYTCSHGFHAGRLKVGCHHAGGLDLLTAIKLSCNAYFCYGLKDMLDNRRKYKATDEAFEVWKNHLVSMGFGYKLGSDLPNEKRGYLPNSGVYDKVYGKGHWKATTIISDAIGQGEILATPLQLANFAAIVANRGYFYTPHLVKQIEGEEIDSAFTTKRYTTIDQKYFYPIADGMELVVKSGTAHWLRNDEIGMCGKTGTAQNPHGKDHALFIAFAPKDNPKIAVSVMVENSGFGATWAAPVAALMIEKFMNGEIKSARMQAQEERILKANLMPLLSPSKQ